MRIVPGVEKEEKGGGGGTPPACRRGSGISAAVVASARVEGEGGGKKKKKKKTVKSCLAARGVTAAVKSFPLTSSDGFRGEEGREEGGRRPMQSATTSPSYSGTRSGKKEAGRTRVNCHTLLAQGALARVGGKKKKKKRSVAYLVNGAFLYIAQRSVRPEKGKKKKKKKGKNRASAACRRVQKGVKGRALNLVLANRSEL